MFVERGTNQFAQKRSNEAKLGAYYTDPEHCARIRNLFRFSDEEETCVLEPSMGDGVAVREATGAEENPRIRIFGVEINADVAEQQQKNPLYETVLKADFLRDVFITNSSFSFVFGNPPYMEEADLYGVGARMRTEFLFLKKVTDYLKPNGIICWVIPYNRFVEESTIGFFMSRYTILSVYKMDDKEFAKWKQVVVIAKKRGCSVGVRREDREIMQGQMVLENIPYLPRECKEEEKIAVPVSEACNVKNFRTITFDPVAAQEWVKTHPECVSSIDAHIRQNTGILGKGNEVYTPPKEPSAASIALLAACGVGNGLVGSVEERNLHLQRGSVHVDTVKTIESKPERNGYTSETLVERSFSVTRQILIESDGTIRDITKKESAEADEQ